MISGHILKYFLSFFISGAVAHGPGTCQLCRFQGSACFCPPITRLKALKAVQSFKLLHWFTGDLYVYAKTIVYRLVLPPSPPREEMNPWVLPQLNIRHCLTFIFLYKKVPSWLQKSLAACKQKNKMCSRLNIYSNKKHFALACSKTKISTYCPSLLRCYYIEVLCAGCYIITVFTGHFGLACCEEQCGICLYDEK